MVNLGTSLRLNVTLSFRGPDMAILDPQPRQPVTALEGATRMLRPYAKQSLPGVNYLSRGTSSKVARKRRSFCHKIWGHFIS